MSLMYLEDFLDYSEDMPQIFHDRMKRVLELDEQVNQIREQISTLRNDLQQLQKEKTRRHESTTGHITTKMWEMSNNLSSFLDTAVQLSVEKVRLVDCLSQTMECFTHALYTETDKFKMELEADNCGITAKLEARAHEEMKQLVRTPGQSTSQNFAVPLGKRKGRPPLAKPNGEDEEKQLGKPSTSQQFMAHRSPAVADLSCLTDFRQKKQLVSSQCLATNATQTTWRAYQQEGVSPARGLSSDKKTPSRIMPTRCKSQRISQVRASMESEVIEESDEEGPYCFCRDNASVNGFMVACDNLDCEIKWFHGACVGFKDSQEPRGKIWYCDNCVKIKKNSSCQVPPGTGATNLGRSTPAPTLSLKKIVPASAKNCVKKK